MTDVFSMRGLDSVLSLLECVQDDALLASALQGTEAGLHMICEEAKALCPKDTGALEKSIAVRLTAVGGEVAAAAPYAVHVEMGTPDMPAQPFLFPAMRTHQQRAAEGIFGAVIGGIRKGEGG